MAQDTARAPAIGRAVPRKDGRDKVTGRARYIDDLASTFPGLLHGATIRSPAARGRIRRIAFGGTIPWSEFTIVTADDIPGARHVTLIKDDQPFLARDVVNHPEEPIALIAHPDRHLLEEARRHVTVEIDPLPGVFTIEDALAKKEIVWGDDNVFKSYLVEKGDVDAALAAPGAIIVDGEYRTQAQEQLYIEPQGVIAVASPAAGVTVWGSMQCPYYVHKALGPLFGLAKDRVRVVQTETGGGFGGKEEYPSIVAGHAALLAWKSGRPVRIVYDRAEDMAATTKRHPSRTRHRTAVAPDGRLIAMEIEFVIDGGAYCTLSPVVLSRGTIHAAGPYRCPNVRIRSKAVATSAPPHGAFRGFGAPQSVFACERHMDRIAARLGIAPDELRRRNFLREGDTTATGQVIREPLDLAGLLDRALDATDFRAKRERFSEENPSRSVKRGIGLAAFMHGSGFTGSGERVLGSKVGIEATRDGRVRVLVANTEIGQGTATILSQIAADALGVDYDMVETAQPDTAVVPDSGPTVASRTCMVVGKLVEDAARSLRARLVASGLLAEPFDAAAFRAACAAHVERHGELKACETYRQPPHIAWDDESYRGDAYGAYAWAVYVAETSVDTVTGEARVDDFVAVQEVGQVIHPVLAAGQIEGGVAQAIGWALTEDVVWKDGRMVNNQMTNYIMPTAADLPPIRVMFEEVPYAFGPAGAKGIGELPMDGPAPAIANALEHALGRPGLDALPLAPERILALLEEADRA
jgi:CO/xanthine dehydrogenase Mo-binding subunit